MGLIGIQRISTRPGLVMLHIFMISRGVRREAGCNLLYGCFSNCPGIQQHAKRQIQRQLKRTTPFYVELNSYDCLLKVEKVHIRVTFFFVYHQTAPGRLGDAVRSSLLAQQGRQKGALILSLWEGRWRARWTSEKSISVLFPPHEPKGHKAVRK